MIFSFRPPLLYKKFRLFFGIMPGMTGASSVIIAYFKEQAEQVEIQTTMIDGTPYYRVRVGPLSDVPAADSSLRSVIAQGHKGARIIVD